MRYNLPQKTATAEKGANLLTLNWYFSNLILQKAGKYIFYIMINKNNITALFKYKAINQMKDDDRKLLNKSSFIVMCPHCSFFPTHQLHHLIEQQTIYQLGWRCPNCEKYNTSSTDHNFKYYQCDSHALVDSTVVTEVPRTLLLLDAGCNMAQAFPNSSGAPYSCKEELTGSKLQMALESKKLTSYLEVVATYNRLNYGKYFSWSKFIRKSPLSKIQYALWLADKLSEEIANLEVHYYSYNDDCGESPLNSFFFSKISEPSVPSPQIEALSNLSKLFSTNTQIVVISSNSLKSLQEYLSIHAEGSPVLIINLQQIVDPITLAPTSTSYYLCRKNSSTKPSSTQPIRNTSKSSANKAIQENQNQKLIKDVRVSKLTDIKIFDHRSYDQSIFTDWLKLIVEMLKGTTNYIQIFIKKAKKNSKAWIWQKVIDKEMCKKVLQKQSKDKVTGVKLFSSSQKAKETDVIEEFNSLMNKNTEITISAMEQFLHNVGNIINHQNKTGQVRICLKFENSKQKLIKNTVLWTNMKPVDANTVNLNEFISLDQNEFQHICRECQECKLWGEKKSQQSYEL